MAQFVDSSYQILQSIIFSRGGDVRLVDLQMFRRGNPSVDLAYLLGTSTSPEMRREHLDSVLRLYHKELVGNLAHLGYKSNMYPFDAFLRDFKHTYFFGIILGSLHSMVSSRLSFERFDLRGHPQM